LLSITPKLGIGSGVMKYKHISVNLENTHATFVPEDNDTHEEVVVALANLTLALSKQGQIDNGRGEALAALSGMEYWSISKAVYEELQEAIMDIRIDDG